MYYTYVLQSEKDGMFYTGYTKDLKLRPARLNPQAGCEAAFNWVKAAQKRLRRIDWASQTPQANLL